MMMMLETQDSGSGSDSVRVEVIYGRIHLDANNVRLTPEEALQIAQALRVYGEVMQLGGY